MPEIDWRRTIEIWGRQLDMTYEEAFAFLRKRDPMLAAELLGVPLSDFSLRWILTEDDKEILDDLAEFLRGGKEDGHRQAV